ncbi:MAG: NUDIX hydrolase [SAR202 cluster bacterium]|nr:NUDIX hydrolase [SAR202 cluster bacterium]
MYGSRRMIYKGKVISLVENTVNIAGKEIRLDQVEHPGSATAVPVLPDGRIILIRQYRFAISDWLWDIPAGLLEQGEAPDACAAREVAEEIGWTVGKLESLGSIVTSPGFSNQRVFMFVAHLQTQVQHSREHGEIMTMHTKDWAEIEGILARNELLDAKTLVALYRYEAMRRR